MTGDAMRDVREAITRTIIETAGLYNPWRVTPVYGGLAPDEIAADRERAMKMYGDKFLAAITAAPAAARLALARAITPDTHAVVPVEATREMLDAGYKAHDFGRNGLGHTYRAMIAAARWPREARMTDAPTD